MKITKFLAKLMLLAPVAIGYQGASAVDCQVPECQPLGYIGPLELSTTDLSNGAKAYRGWFENGSWQGDLIQYDISSDGALSTDVDLSGSSPAAGGGNNWSAHVEFASRAATTPNWWSSGASADRKIIFSNNYGSNQKAFRWENFTVYQKAALDNLTAVDATNNPSPVVNYLRGDRTNEGPTGSMRTRFTVLGDIIHSNPTYVGVPSESYTDSDYVDFKNLLAARPKRVYVGANDGMLHAFNAWNGKEMWAYVPSMIIPKMKRLAGRPYAHTYFVDGGITVRDARVQDGRWRTVLVGSLGAGGKGIYALDVTHQALSSETATDGNARKIMWEERGENTPGDPEPGANPDIGYIFDPSTIAQGNDGKWYAYFGNGIGSTNGDAVLMLKELRTDWTVVAPIQITAATGTDNGLSAPALVDTDGDGRVDVAWAGDIKGDLWRFNLEGADGWSTAYKVYDGDPSQPITTAPDVAIHPDFGHIVYFGTGKLYEDADTTSTTRQALYGIWDTGSQPTYTEPLLDQLLSLNTDYNRFGFSERVRTFTTTVKVDYSTYKGWRVELYAGERMLTTPQVRAGRMKTTIYNPNDGTNWLLEADFVDGNMADDTIYNLNQDTALDELDRVNGNGNLDGAGAPNYSDPEDIPMAWKRPDGNMSQPTIASLSAGVDTMFLNFLNPPVVESAIAAPQGCVGACVGGLEGGHIDLDYDVSLGGGTDDHTHEYDDDVNRTYIDYLDVIQQRDVTEVVDNEELFIPLISNADFSKGGTLVISRTGSTNDIEYNVVQYQKMIHEAIYNWDGASDLKDPSNRSLIFKLSEVDKFQMQFNSLALISGGLHPSETGCVRDNNANFNRWRNGALTMHLVKASHFAGLEATENALDRLRVTLPDDFQEAVYLTDGTGVALYNDRDNNDVLIGTRPHYEIAGGLVAEEDLGDPGFLYESTMFWHFDGPCYGRDGWAQAYFTESQNTAYAVFYEALDRVGVATLDELAAYIDGLLASGCADAATDSGDKCDKDCEPVVEDPNNCQEEYQQLSDLYEVGQMIEATGITVNCGEEGCLGDGDNGGGDGGGSGTTLSGDPLPIVGGIDPTGITSGPNFVEGRRTWIDILPE